MRLSGRVPSALGRPGFTLLEVVIALAMLALLAVPAVGLATMALSQGEAGLTAGLASELRRRIDVAMRTQGYAFTIDVDESAWVFWASEDLKYIEPEGSKSLENDGYYRVRMSEPEGYDYNDGTDAYRILCYDVVWPNDQAKRSARQQLVFVSVFRK